MNAVLALMLAVAPASTGEWHLTVDGWGPVRIGMSRAQVERALDAKLEGEALDDEESCIEMEPAGHHDGSGSCSRDSG